MTDRIAEALKKAIAIDDAVPYKQWRVMDRAALAVIEAAYVSQTCDLEHRGDSEAALDTALAAWVHAVLGPES